MKVIPAKQPKIPNTAPVEVKVMGNGIEVRYLARDMSPAIQKLDADSYIELSTGEVKEFDHADARIDDPASIRQSFRRLRDLINYNVTNPENSLFITLTYRKNMQSETQLYEDFRRFNQRFQYYCQQNGLPRYEYIVVMEPQRRGAYHAHLLTVFPEKAPFIRNEDIGKIWGHGFTNTRGLKDSTNLGLYLTAYFTDLDIMDAFRNRISYHPDQVKQVQVEDETGQKQNKAVVKGGRLKMYPAGFRLYRKSQGLKYPPVIQCTEAEAMQLVGEAPMVYTRTIDLLDDHGNFINTISYRTYNRRGKFLSPVGEAVRDGE